MTVTTFGRTKPASLMRCTHRQVKRMSNHKGRPDNTDGHNETLTIIIKDIHPQYFGVNCLQCEVEFLVRGEVSTDVQYLCSLPNAVRKSGDTEHRRQCISTCDGHGRCRTGVIPVTARVCCIEREQDKALQYLLKSSLGNLNIHKACTTCYMVAHIPGKPSCGSMHIYIRSSIVCE